MHLSICWLLRQDTAQDAMLYCYYCFINWLNIYPKKGVSRCQRVFNLCMNAMYLIV